HRVASRRRDAGIRRRRDRVGLPRDVAIPICRMHGARGIPLFGMELARQWVPFRTERASRRHDRPPQFHPAAADHMKTAVIVFPGSNRDHDIMAAIEAVTGRRPLSIWHTDTRLPALDLIV